MSEFATRFAAQLWSLLLDTGVWLVVGLVLAGVVHVLIPRSVLARHLAGRGVAPILKASLLGIPLPLCSCSVIPVAAGLRASGASKGASAAFAISTPQTGEESIPLTWALFGPVYALIRPVLAVATAFAAGLLIDRFADRHAADAPAPKPAAGGSCCHAPKPAPPAPAAPVALTIGSCCDDEPAKPCCASKTPPQPVKPCCAHEPASARRPSRAVEIVRYGFVTLLRDLSPWLTIGLLLSALISAAVPEGWIESTIGTGLVPMLLMLVVGLPLYICATSTTPLAYTLVVAGLSPGAALVLLLAGPATNVATMSWVLKDLGARALAIYLATIACFAVAGGWAFDASLRGFVRLADHAHAHEHAAISTTQTTGAVLFSVLLLWALVARYARPGPPAPSHAHA